MTAQEAQVLRALLTSRNTTLLRNWLTFEEALSRKVVPQLLEPYRDMTVSLCKRYYLEAEKNLQLLQLKNDSILQDLLSRTQLATEYLRVTSSRIAPPITRCSPDDALCLQIITDIHNSHLRTKGIPAAFTSGDVAVLPMMTFAPIYFFPSLEQIGLLFQPLHYHEFGHGLYVLYRREMEDLIKELQEEIAKVLIPLSQRNDPHGIAQAKQRQNVVDRWFDWIQEIFCDAVGVTLGGPAYLYAFSAYCNKMSRSDLYRSAGDLEVSEHPVTRLRIRLLVKRAYDMGLMKAAKYVEEEWNTLAGVMHVAEDYHGYFEDAMEHDVHRIVDDMLLVASPRQFQPDEVADRTTSEREVKPADTSVSLLNFAWHVYNQEPDAYAGWEKQAIAAYLA